MTPTVRKCSRCKEEKDISAFYTGRCTTICRKCTSTRSARWAKANRSKRRTIANRWSSRNAAKRKISGFTRYKTIALAMRGQHLSRNFWPHLSWQDALAEFDRLMSLQSSTCAICFKKFSRTAHVDHDHTTGEVRGLLCGSCNRGIGYLQDKAELCMSAHRYLSR